MRRRSFPIGGFVAVQVIVLAAFVAAYAGMSVDSSGKLQRAITGRVSYAAVQVERRDPLRVLPLYDDPDVVSDEELAAVLKQIRPRFARKQTKPNHVEHALRTWGVDATFQDPDVMSGIELRDFLIDHAKYLAAWGEKTQPLLQVRPGGIAIRWGRSPGASVHHDHCLACLTEAGIALNEPVFAPGGRQDVTINDVLQEALLDFRLDERETEWSAMTLGLWMPPTKSWRTADGRWMSFDRIANRLMRGHKRFGVCSGTHRVYSLMLLIRLDDDFHILSPTVRHSVHAHLRRVRDLLIASQADDGHWPSNWSLGAGALDKPADDPDYRKVIATGHHLEWLAIAPQEFHPPRQRIRKAAAWLIEHTTELPPEAILKKYTFYSHVGNALALWRSTRPAVFWREWQTSPTPGRSHPDL